MFEEYRVIDNINKDKDVRRMIYIVTLTFFCDRQVRVFSYQLCVCVLPERPFYLESEDKYTS